MEDAPMYGPGHRGRPQHLMPVSAGRRAAMIAIAKRGDTVVLDLGDQFTVRTRQDLRQAVSDEIESGERQFLIDFSHTGYVDSSGLGALIAISKQVDEAGGQLVLTNLNDDLRSLFELTKLDTLFRIIDTDADGMGPPHRPLNRPHA